MASFGNSFADSPVLAMPPLAIHQALIDTPIHARQSRLPDQSAPWHPSPVRTRSSGAGRKRSRDEASVNLDPPEKIVEPPIINKEPEDEWVYGPGMTLIKRNASYVVDASSQSGTWLEEKAAEEDAEKAEAALLTQERLSQERPSLRSHKSQRLDAVSGHSPVDGAQNKRSSPTRDVANPATLSSDSLGQPIVDDFTLHLGIGWSRLGDGEHIQAAARGWGRYIERHFPVTNARLRLESRGLQSYLVEANEGFFLFAEDLRQGRLVSRDVSRALQNLKTSPPTFDGPETMGAAESPKLEPVPNAAIDMDMS